MSDAFQRFPTCLNQRSLCSKIAPKSIYWTLHRINLIEARFKNKLAAPSQWPAEVLPWMPGAGVNFFCPEEILHFQTNIQNFERNFRFVSQKFLTTIFQIIYQNLPKLFFVS